MMKWLCFVTLCMIAGCGIRSSEQVVDVQETVITVGDARFVFPESSIVETTAIRIQQKTAGRQMFASGYHTQGIVFSVMPDTITFLKPVQFLLPFTDANAALAAGVGHGFVPVAGSGVDADTLTAVIRHGGEYYVVSRPDRYGIQETDNGGAGLLIVSDLYVSEYIDKFQTTCRQAGYDLPIWTFVYPGERTIEENARMLADELKDLHNRYGEFRCDVVGFGIGGLITHRYMNDTALYGRDISSAVIAVGTPFSGSSFSDHENAAAAQSSYRFYYLDALGANAAELGPGSRFMEWMKEHRKIVGGYYYDNIEENKNFASIRGVSVQPGAFPEEYAGDGLVSLHSTLLTPIEPEPFALLHFDLFENNRVLHTLVEFVKLYRSFNWPLLFSQVWGKEAPMSRISELWEREARLMYGDLNFHVLLEWNENMLRSTPPNAVLITNGDNDTYPAWFLQQQGVRSDILIVNRSLLNIPEYGRFLMEQGLSLDITDTELAEIKHKKVKGDIITRADQLIKRLVTDSQRPLVLSTTVWQPERFGFPLTMVGMVYEIGEHGEKVDDTRIDVERTQQYLFKTFSYEKYISIPQDSLSDVMASMGMNYAAAALRLSQALQQVGRYEEARESITLARQFTDSPFYTAYQEAALYMKMKKYETADTILNGMLGQEDVDIELRKSIAEKYYEMGRIHKAIEILSDCLKQDPASSDIPELIKRYQEEL